MVSTDGVLIGFKKVGPLNYEVLPGGFQQLENEMKTIIDEMITSNNLKPENLQKGVFGMAGVDTVWQHQTISKILKRCGIDNFILCNDAFLPIKAVSKTGWGICSINGTGCVNAGIDPAGRMLQIGGCGELTGDKGGGGYLGRIAVGAVYTHFYKSTPSTILKDLLFSHLGITDDEELLETVSEKLETEDLILSDLNRLLFEAAALGDSVAQEILRESGEDGAVSAFNLIKRLDFPLEEAVDVVLAGSVYVKGEHDILVSSFKTKLNELIERRKVNVTVANKPPVMGAVVWALEEYMSSVEAIEKISFQFNGLT